jgi:hypothetical protein
MGPRNQIRGMDSASLCSLAGRYDKPLPPRFLAPIDSLKIPALFRNLPYAARGMFPNTRESTHGLYFYTVHCPV